MPESQCFWTQLVNATQNCVQQDGEEEMKYIACFDGFYAYGDDTNISFEIGGGCISNPFVLALDPEQLGIVANINANELVLVDSVAYSATFQPSTGISAPSASGTFYTQPRAWENDITADGYVLRSTALTIPYADSTFFRAVFPRPNDYASGDQPYFYIRLKFTYPGIDGLIYYSNFKQAYMN